jgi:hypothetical protein
MKTTRGIILRKINFSQRKFRKLKEVTLYSISKIPKFAWFIRK